MLLATIRRMGGVEGAAIPASSARADPWKELRAAISAMGTVWERREMRLSETDAKYRTLLGQVPAVPYVASLDDTLGKVIISPQIGALLGFSPGDWLQSPDLWIRHIHPDDRKRVLDQIRHTHASGEPLSCEYRMLDRYGRVLWFRDEAQVVRNRQGRPQFLRGLLVDTSERKRAEEALRESEERFRRIVDTAHEGIWVVDLSGKTSYANQRMAEMLGVGLQEILGCSFEDFLDLSTLHTDPNAGTASPPQGQFRREVALRRKDGSVVWALVASSPLANGSGQLVGTLHMVAEISERKRMEEQLRQSGERLRLLASHLEKVREEERSWIAREIHDELGQGLTALKLELAGLERRLARSSGSSTEKEVLRERIREMSRSVDNTIRAVREICTQLHPPILDNLGLEAAIEWQLAEFERKTGVSCLFHPWDHEPGLDMGKTTALFRVFQELLTNAARHSEASRIEVRLHANPEFVILELRDNGRGIGEEAIRGAGGLGLLGIRERVALLGGKMILEGHPGEGTRAEVCIPVGGSHAEARPSSYGMDRWPEGHP